MGTFFNASYRKGVFQAISSGILLTVAAVGLVIAFTWPWCLSWGDFFLNHIDPPFHAWKLEFMARRILAGDVFFSSGNTNMLYPNSGALYFEALQYPASLAAAPLLAMGMRPESAYHIILVFFWALAAPCMRFLLRELDCRPLAATVGALLFTILPLRTRYMVALQLELVFALPLFYAFLVRFFRKPNVCDAILAALSMWLLAISELNGAVFAAMTAPFIAFAFIAARPRLLVSRKFWLSALAGGATMGASVFILLHPYLVQRGEGSVNRAMAEIIKNSGQPFAYLLPWGRFRPWEIPHARADELSVYPTLAILALALLACVLWWRGSSVCGRRWQGACGVASATCRAIRIAAPALCALYALILLPCQLQWCEWSKPFNSVFRQVSNLVAFCAVALVFAPARDESTRVSFLRGFAAAVILVCILSFGPLIKMGHPGNYLLCRSNHLYKTLLDILPMLSSFRTVSRFGTLVVFFVFCAAICALDATMRRAESARSGIVGRQLSTVLAAGIFVACAIECVPPRKWNTSYRKIDHPRDSPAISRLFAVHPIRTLVGIPMGERHMEGMRMFSLVKGDFPYVYAWCGYFPQYSQDILDSHRMLLRDQFHDHVASMFPPSLIFVDHNWVSRRNRRVTDKTPLDSIRRMPNGREEFDIELWLSRIAEKVDSDNRFSIWEPSPLPPAPVAIRRCRTDVALMNPVLSADVATSADATVQVSLNGECIGRASANGDGLAYFTVDLRTLPRRLWSRSAPNVISFSCEDAGGKPPVQILRFSMLAEDGSYKDPCAPYTVTARPPPPHEPYRPQTFKDSR